jgi:hypothetical protein
MDASQLIRIRMENAQKFVARAQPVDSSLNTYRKMITAASGGIVGGQPASQPRTSGISGQAASPGYVEQYSNPRAEPVAATLLADGTRVIQTRALVQEDHLRLGSQGSGSFKYSCDSVAYRNAGRAECTGPVANGEPLALPTPGCDSSGVYYEPGSYDLSHPDERLLVPAPCAPTHDERRVVPAPCANDGTPVYLNGAWTNVPSNKVVYPALPSA